MMTDLLDLDLLRTFVLAVDKKSFAKAAEHVFRSQSAVSLQMQRLEDLTGQQLFVKQGRGWQLTANGDLLLSYARKMLELNDRAIQALSATPLTGLVKLGMRIDFSESSLPQVLANFVTMYPQVQIEVVVDKEDVLMQKLQSGKLDIVTTFGMTVPDNAILVGKLPLRWIGNGNAVVAQQNPLPLLLFEAPCLFRNAALEALDIMNRSWRPVLTASSVAGMWAGAQAGLGIAIRTEMGLPVGCKVVPQSAGLPALPEINVFILTGEKSVSPAIQQMVEILVDNLKTQLYDISKKALKSKK